MKKLLLVLALLLAPTGAWAQCTGVFPANTLCGNLGATPAPPAAFNAGGTVIGPSSTSLNTVATWGNTSGTSLSNLAIPNGNLMANASGHTAPAGSTAPSSWLDQAFCSTVGYILQRFTSGWVCTQNQPVSVLAFGADSTGVADTSTACMSAFAALPPTGGTVIFPPGYYNFTSNCTIPPFSQTNSATVPSILVEMTGAQLQTTTASVHIFDRVPANQTSANTMVITNINFHGGLLTGTGTDSLSVGINMGATGGMLLNGTDFNGLGIGLNCQFCLEATILNSHGSDLIYDWKLENGSWSGAGTCNAQSNNVFIANIESHVLTNGVIAPLAVHASDGVKIDTSVFEGSNPVNDIDFNDEGCSTVKSFKMENIHIENTPTNAIVKVGGTGGQTFTLTNFIAQASVPYLLDISSLSGGTAFVNVLDIPYIGNFSGAIFNLTAFEASSSTAWHFRNWAGNITPSTSTYWASGRVPNNLSSIAGTVEIGASSYRAGGLGGVSCNAGTTSAATLVVTGGIVTHC